MTLVDAEARRRIREDLDTTFVVEAAAGTGKTTELIARIIAVIGEGRARLDQVVAVTFTEMAAGEMKLRLRTELDRARREATDPVRARRFEAAAEAMETARMGTIHSFCADLLRERPVQAGIDPGFAVLSENDADRLLDRAFDQWFQSALAAPPQGVRRFLRRDADEQGRDGPRARLRWAARALIERRDFDGAWPRASFDRNAVIDALWEEVEQLGALGVVTSGNDALLRHLRRLHREHLDVVEEERQRPRDHDALERRLGLLLDDKGWNDRGRVTEERRPLLARRAALHRRLTAFAHEAEADLAAALHAELQPVVTAYVALLRKAGALDFLDLLLVTRDLVRDDASVRHELQERFTHLFVDEFQDTDPLQAEIVLCLAGDGEVTPGKLFVVGDPKQAIYRFRRADVTLYERVKRDLMDQGGALLRLSTSFRAQPAIQSMVNASFAPLMQGAEDGSQATYVPLEPFRASTPQPSVVALAVPRPYGARGFVTKTAVAASLPDAVGAYVHWLVTDSGWSVEVDGKAVPLAARHICLLFTRMQGWGGVDISRPYVRALEDRQVPHVLVGGRSLFGREEVMAMRAVLEAIEWPYDRLSVYAVLRGPFFSFTDQELFRYRETVAPLSPLALDRPAGDEGIGAVLDALAQWHRRRNRQPIADTLTQVLEMARAHAAVAIWPNGEQALANLSRMVEEARRFDRQATSFRAFIEHLEALELRQRSGEAPVVEEGAEGVRIMTVHRSKGLEFPVVVLCDPGAPGQSSRPSRHIDPENRRWSFPLAGCIPLELRANEKKVLDHDNAERLRLLYVAATRARDLLVLPAAGDAPVRGWLEPLHPAIYPDKGAQPRRPPGCPPLGDDTVAERPSHAAVGPEDIITPGLYRASAGRHGVVWWGPSALALGARQAGGLRQTELLKDSEAEVVAAGREAYARWRDARREHIAQAAQPRRPACTVTAFSARHDEEGPAVSTVTTNRTEGRPHGARFGTLVHALLAELAVDLDPEAPGLSSMAAAMARMLGNPDDEVEAAIVAVRVAMAHPLWQRARASAEIRREVPVSMLRDGEHIEGIVDLAFREPGGWVVVDFKTDLGPLPSRYAWQVAAYAEAIAAATGQPVTERILFRV